MVIEIISFIYILQKIFHGHHPCAVLGNRDPGESHGQRSLVGYSPRICKESDVIEPLTISFFLFQKEDKGNFCSLGPRLAAVFAGPSTD